MEILKKIGFDEFEANKIALSTLIVLSNEKYKVEDIFKNSVNKEIEDVEKIKQENFKDQIEAYRNFVNLNIEHKILSAKKMELPFSSKEYLAISSKIDTLSSNIENFDYSKFELINIEKKEDFLNLLNQVEDNVMSRYRNDDFYKRQEIFELLCQNDNIQRDKVMEMVFPKVQEYLEDKLSEFSYEDLIEKINKKIFSAEKEKNLNGGEDYSLLDASKDIYKYTLQQQLKTLKLGG